MTSDAVIETTSLTHCYGDRFALADVNLTANRGEIFGLLGPNGGGKTTLFKILVTLMQPTSGSARVGGADVVTQQDHVRRQLGVVFQNASLDAHLSVRENMEHQGHLYGLRGASLAERIVELLERFGLAERAKERVAKLSGGLKRRVELAKALLHRPTVLILDEPSTGLDPAARNVFMDFLCELRDAEGVACLLTTHLMDEADRCDRIAVIDEGNLAAVDTPDNLKQQIGGEVLTVSTQDATGLAREICDRFRVDAVETSGTVRLERADGHRFVPELIEAFPGRIESVTVGKPTLEDVFFHLTGHRLWGSNEKSTST